jgi:hypothetical protein
MPSCAPSHVPSLFADFSWGSARVWAGPAAVGKRDQAKVREAAEDSAGVDLELDDGRP